METIKIRGDQLLLLVDILTLMSPPACDEYSKIFPLLSEGSEAMKKWNKKYNPRDLAQRAVEKKLNPLFGNKCLPWDCGYQTRIYRARDFLRENQEVIAQMKFNLTPILLECEAGAGKTSALVRLAKAVALGEITEPDLRARW